VLSLKAAPRITALRARRLPCEADFNLTPWERVDQPQSFHTYRLRGFYDVGFTTDGGGS